MYFAMQWTVFSQSRMHVQDRNHKIFPVKMPELIFFQTTTRQTVHKTASRRKNMLKL